MLRRLAPALLALPLILACAGPTKLAKKSEEKLAGGDAWRAWQLATKALDREPGNPRARHAAAASGAMIVQEWRHKIHGLTSIDTLQAAEQVLELADFRASAVPYAVLPAGDVASIQEEQVLRNAAARIHYQRGLAARDARRPKAAYLHFAEVDHYVTGYRDAARLAESAWAKAMTRVAIMPFQTSADLAIGSEAADAWREALMQDFSPEKARFTRLIGGDAIEQSMTVSQLRGLSREDAVRIGRRAGAQRIVLGTIGGVKSQTRLHLFHDMVARRITVRDQEGNSTTRWATTSPSMLAAS